MGLMPGLHFIHGQWEIGHLQTTEANNCARDYLFHGSTEAMIDCWGANLRLAPVNFDP